VYETAAVGVDHRYSGQQSDVSLAVCDRALFQVLQTEPGLERQSVDKPDQHQSMDVGIRSGLLATAAHAR
jgi:hypothetical protein